MAGDRAVEVGGTPAHRTSVPGSLPPLRSGNGWATRGGPNCWKARPEPPPPVEPSSAVQKTSVRGPACSRGICRLPRWAVRAFNQGRVIDLIGPRSRCNHRDPRLISTSRLAARREGCVMDTDDLFPIPMSSPPGRHGSRLPRGTGVFVGGITSGAALLLGILCRRSPATS